MSRVPADPAQRALELEREVENRRWSNLAAQIGLVGGPLLAGLMLLAGPPTGLSAAGWATLALLLVMVIWWITEALPIAATALLPLVALPLAGVANPVAAAASYADPIIFLFIGGFIIAAAIERWNLHTRIALSLAGAIGARPVALVASFLLAAALLSMWISNTATALMLMSTAIGVVRAMTPAGQAPDRAFAAALVIAVAYGASIGGIGTPVGSPTNLVAMGYLERNGLALDFSRWMLLALPIMLAMLACAWVLLSWRVRRVRADAIAGRAVIASARAALGPISAPERRVLVVFLVVAAAWMFRPLLASVPGFAGLSDMGIAIAGALVLFVLPSGAPGPDRGALLDWPSAERLPWGVALLFGGGLTIAAAMSSTGVTDWLGSELSQLGIFTPFLALLLIVTVTIFATELTSNTATLTAMLPVVGALSQATGLPALHLAFGASIAASMAFMLPIATPPNAIAYGTGHVRIADMARVGLWLNLVGIVVIVAIVEALAPLLAG